MNVERWNPERDGALTESKLARKLETLGYRVARYVYPPGTVFETHRHDIDKVDAVVSGRFRVEMEGKAIDLGPGDSVYVPRGTDHRAEVLGNDPVVSLDATLSRSGG